VTFTGVGTCVVDANQSGGTNYTAADQVQQSITAGKAALTVGPSSTSVVYGSPVPAVTPSYQGFKLGDGASDVTGVTCSTDYQQGDGVASTPTDTCTGPASTDDYDITYRQGTVTVTPATLTVTPKDQSMIYGGTAPSFTFTETGFVLGEDSSATTTAPTCGALDADGQIFTVTADTPGGTYSIGCTRGAAVNYTFDETATATLTISAAETGTLYTGDQSVLAGSTFTVAAQSFSAAQGCRSGQTVTFTVDHAPHAGASTTIGTATSSDGTASTTVDASSWNEGVYTITATLAGTPSCGTSTDVTTLTLGGAGQQATAGGWYTLPGTSTKVTGTLDVSATSQGTYSGDATYQEAGDWQITGAMSASVVVGDHGSVSGVGTLSQWDPTLGAWQTVASKVAFTVSLGATGHGRSHTTQPGTVGLHIDYHPAAGAPSLPNTLPQQLTHGHIGVS
jgi:hypothetical protein